MGRIVRLFAATAALTFIGVSGAAAGGYGGGWYGYGPGNWGCASSGCAPLYVPPVSCCAPVRWGCGNPCGYGYGHGYGISTGFYGVQRPLHVVHQGPSYDPPLTGYTYPVGTYDEPRVYPYRPLYRPWGYRGYRVGVGVRPFYRHRVGSFHRTGYVGMRRQHVNFRRSWR
jgi:hypothetical protein